MGNTIKATAGIYTAVLDCDYGVVNVSSKDGYFAGRGYWAENKLNGMPGLLDSEVDEISAAMSTAILSQMLDAAR